MSLLSSSSCSISHSIGPSLSLCSTSHLHLHRLLGTLSHLFLLTVNGRRKKNSQVSPTYRFFSAELRLFSQSRCSSSSKTKNNNKRRLVLRLLNSIDSRSERQRLFCELDERLRREAYVVLCKKNSDGQRLLTTRAYPIPQTATHRNPSSFPPQKKIRIQTGPLCPLFPDYLY